MFSGHPYLEQEKRRAARDAEEAERQRVLRLIADAKLKHRDGVVPTWEPLDELARAVRQGHRRL